jgi:site-specific DNA recombinase
VPPTNSQTYEHIQARLHERARAPVKKKIGIDFPLRGFVECGECGEPLTACWSRSGTGKKHPYYLCYNRDCASARKSIPRDKLEGEFVQIVARLQPSERMVTLAHAMFKDAWDQRVAQGKAAQAHPRNLLSDLAKQTDRMPERIVESDNAAVIAAYERKVADLENRKLILSEQLETEGKPHHAFEDMFELALSFLSNPWKLWASGQYHLRRIVLRLAFSDHVTYCRQSGLSNVKIALPFNILMGFSGTKFEVAHRAGFEPTTPRFVVWCSIQLSYRCFQAPLPGRARPGGLAAAMPGHRGGGHGARGLGVARAPAQRKPPPGLPLASPRPPAGLPWAGWTNAGARSGVGRLVRAAFWRPGGAPRHPPFTPRASGDHIP